MDRGVNAKLRTQQLARRTAGVIERRRPPAQPVHTARGTAHYSDPPVMSGVPDGNTVHVPAGRISFGTMPTYGTPVVQTRRDRHFHFRGFVGRGRFDY